MSLPQPIVYCCWYPSEIIWPSSTGHFAYVGAGTYDLVDEVLLLVTCKDTGTNADRDMLIDSAELEEAGFDVTPGIEAALEVSTLELVEADQQVPKPA